MSQPAISKHLKVLERAGLISRGRDARRAFVGLRGRPMPRTRLRRGARSRHAVHAPCSVIGTMLTPSRLDIARLRPLAAIALLSLLPLARAQASETITATATVKTAAGVTSTAPVSVIVDRFSTDSDRDEVMAAIKKGGTEALRSLLLTRPPIGTVKVGTAVTSIKYVYQRVTPEGRLVTAVTGSVIGYLGAGAPGARPKSGFYLGLVLIEITGATGHGELIPATKVRVDDKGAIVTDGYSDDVVRLSNVSGK
jgi:hypothetical protein